MSDIYLHSAMPGKRGRKPGAPRDHAKIMENIVDPDVSDNEDTFSPRIDLQSTVVDASNDTFELNNTHKRQKDDEGKAATTSAQAKVSFITKSLFTTQSNLSHPPQREYEMAQHVNAPEFIPSPGHKRTAAALLDVAMGGTGGIDVPQSSNIRQFSPANLLTANQPAIGDTMSKSFSFLQLRTANLSSRSTGSVQRVADLMKRRDHLRDQVARMERAAAMFESGRDPTLSLRELDATRQSLEEVEAVLFGEVESDVDGAIIDAVIDNENAHHDDDLNATLTDEEDEVMETDEQAVNDLMISPPRDPRTRPGYPLLVGSFAIQNSNVFHSTNAPPLVPMQAPQIVMIRSDQYSSLSFRRFNHQWHLSLLLHLQ